MGERYHSWSIEVSVIVCTYNRCQSLAATLGALAAQRLNPSRWELLVVDNNSLDATAPTVQAFQQQHPQLRCHYLFEAKQGLSHARNRGIACARSGLILFTDDDVMPEPDWIERFIETMATFDCDACGGHVAPLWEKTPPPGSRNASTAFSPFAPMTEAPASSPRKRILPLAPTWVSGKKSLPPSAVLILVSAARETSWPAVRSGSYSAGFKPWVGRLYTPRQCK